MYNGIGLDTVRGSGTNGYVQRNLSQVRRFPDRVDYKNEDELKKFDAQFNKKPNKDILEHDRKRKVEVKCFEMRELMEEQGFNDNEIETKVSQFRKLLMEKESVSDAGAVLKDDFGRAVATETHQMALATEEKNARWRDAFGIAERDDERQRREGRGDKDAPATATKEAKQDDGKERKKDKKHKRDRSDEGKKHKKRRPRSESPRHDKHRSSAEPTSRKSKRR